MSKRLYMTSADYLVIAISPALIMALVGSLVFFLIEVFYAGEYQARLNYSFALFVFAAVLIARISIEMGSERAALFAVPLAVAMFLFLVKFVEHPSPFSHVINLALMAIVWWCAHRLTWDSTVVDDDEDASGEGLMQRIGVDGPETASVEKKTSGAAPAVTTDNELLDRTDASKSPAAHWLKQLFRPRKGPHTPGIWVLYFSLAALPLFGVGQHWIPASDAGRRRYAFFLLFVYVAAALALLVTTSFLNLRRYLRQRRIEMPLTIVGNWVGIGAVLIVIAMMLALLIPRPNAEVAVSRVPWQAGSPSGMSASRTSVYRDGGEDPDEQQDPTGGDRSTDKGEGNLPPNGEKSESSSEPIDSQEKGTQDSDQGSANSAKGEKGKQKEVAKGEKSSEKTQQKADKSVQKASDNAKPDESSKVSQKTPDEKRRNSTASSTKPSTPPSKNPLDAIRSISSSFGGVFGVLKILFYIVAGLLLLFLIWKYRVQILQAINDILSQLRALFGGKKTTADEDENANTAAVARPPRFAEFRDPFLSDQHKRMPPEELVRYTFAAFEAWARDRGRPRTLDCTPQELINVAVEPKTPLFDEARRMVRMYGEVAYASRRIPRETANELSDIWQLMRATHMTELAVPASP